MRAAYILLVGALPLFSQSVSGPVFEAASVKPVTNRSYVFGIEGGPGTPSPTRLRAAEAHLSLLLQEALDVPPYKVVDQAKIPEKFFEIEAVLPEGATKAAYRTMLLNLLIERFELRFHRETRNLPLYELRIADGGHRLKPSVATPVTREPGFRPTTDADGYLVFPPDLNTPVWGNGPRFSVQRVATTLDDFTRDVVEDWYKQPVANRTGLAGKYDIYLRFNAANSNPTNLRADDPSSTEPPFVPALKEQLGLLLRESKGPQEVIVIDSINANPSAN